MTPAPGDGRTAAEPPGPGPVPERDPDLPDPDVPDPVRPGPGRGSRASRIPAAERGATRIADRVVARIAAQAAREAVGTPPAGGAAPHATVTVHHDIARVRISLELDYPTDLGARCAAVRSRVTGRVEELAGMAVPEVDIEVERLHPAPRPASGRGGLR